MKEHKKKIPLGLQRREFGHIGLNSDVQTNWKRKSKMIFGSRSHINFSIIDNHRNLNDFKSVNAGLFCSIVGI